MIPLPKKFLTYLAVSCGMGGALYVLLMIGTLYFASSATELSAEARAIEADVIALEARYYAAIAELSKTDPFELGYVMPAKVVYVTALGSPALSRAEQ